MSDQSQKQQITLVFEWFINYHVKGKKKSNFCLLHQKKFNLNFLPFYMIIYTPFERSRRLLKLFVVFDFDQTYICIKNSKNMEKKVSFQAFSGTFRLLVNSAGILQQKF